MKARETLQKALPKSFYQELDQYQIECIEEAMVIFAKEACKEQKELCADESDTQYACRGYLLVDIPSVLNARLPNFQ